MIAISKETLRELNRHRGTVDTSTGMVFDGFVGRLFLADMLYHGEVKYSAPDPEQSPLQASFDINAIINPRGTVNGDACDHDNV